MSDAAHPTPSTRSRASVLTAMGAEPVDVLIVGGGIVGAATAREAALRGLRTALVDRGDFAGATSSESSRLVHGGLRYLEHGDLRLVREASRERAVLLRIAPHLVRPLGFVFPLYRGGRIPAWQLRAGLWVYDALAGFRNTRMHRWLRPRRVSQVEPRLRTKGLVGAGLYYDAQTDDARLALATLRSAVSAGALVANYAAVTSLLKSDGDLRGAVVEDALGTETLSVHARTVVNATGPWVDRLRRLDDPAAAPLLRATKGVHVTVSRARLGHTHAIAFLSPVDGRVMFVLPWGDLSYIGTTDTDEDVPRRRPARRARTWCISCAPRTPCFPTPGCRRATSLRRGPGCAPFSPPTGRSALPRCRANTGSSRRNRASSRSPGAS